MTPGIDFQKLGAHLLKAGEEYDMKLTGTPVFRVRRIEAGLLNAGSDFDETTTPFMVGLGKFIDLKKSGFVGQEALRIAKKNCLTWGMRVNDGVAALGHNVYIDNQVVGKVCSNGWSPFLQCGVAIVRMDHPDHGPNTKVTADCIDGKRNSAELCLMPFYDEKGEIPRGKRIDIPTVQS